MPWTMSARPTAAPSPLSTTSPSPPARVGSPGSWVPTAPERPPCGSSSGSPRPTRALPTCWGAGSRTCPTRAWRSGCYSPPPSTRAERPGRSVLLSSHPLHEIEVVADALSPRLDAAGLTHHLINSGSLPGWTVTSAHQRSGLTSHTISDLIPTSQPTPHPPGHRTGVGDRGLAASTSWWP